jgi:hypothetical protein
VKFGQFLMQIKVLIDDVLIGDPIVELVELQLVYQLDDKRVGMSRECN